MRQRPMLAILYSLTWPSQNQEGILLKVGKLKVPGRGCLLLPTFQRWDVQPANGSPGALASNLCFCIQFLLTGRGLRWRGLSHAFLSEPSFSMLSSAESSTSRGSTTLPRLRLDS